MNCFASCTSVDLLAVHDQVVDVLLDLNYLLLLLSLLLLPSLHQCPDVRREELRLERVDDVEEELSVDCLQLRLIELSCSLLNQEIREILLQHFVIQGVL